MGASAGLVLINNSWVSWLILFLFLIFSIASGVASVAFKDVSGKTIDKGLRGQMLGARATIGGALSLGAGVVLHLFIAGSQNIKIYAALFGISSILWIGAAYLFYKIKEQPGATEGGEIL
ncbi:hypothetical protein [Mangrovivirga cuniculi]|uniref:hypothetical protein n=1 Tax=Mangrovivirga cuniculi TaxID=2715131 RepID=UPI001C30E7E1|nr:hypothetical protein [Mangrovivirga cuniculi]